MRKLKAIALALLLGAVIGMAGQAHAAETLCPTPGNTKCNPCTIFNQLIGVVNGPLLADAIDPGLLGFLGLLSGNVADIDGPFQIDDSGDSLIASLSGDDIRDVAGQMQLLKFIIDNPSRFPAGSAIPSAELSAAFTANRLKLEEKIGSFTGSLQLLLPPVIPALTWFTMLGKESDFSEITSEDPIVTFGSGTTGVLRALLVLLSDVELNGTPLNFADTTVNPGDFITYGDKIGPDADLDGDGFSNVCEYRHFRRNLCTTSPAFTNIAPAENTTIDFVTAVLDPTIKPTGCFEVEDPTVDDCSHSMGPEAVVPPALVGPLGSVRYRRFENTVTGAERYQINFLQTIESSTPSAKVVKGLPGQAGSEVLLNVPNANPEFWEVYVSAATAQRMKQTPNYFEVTGVTSETPPITYTIRGDNSCGVLAPPPPVPHAADTNGDFIIQETEILTVIEYINEGGLSCSGNGFVAGPGDQSCTPHDSDYSPQDWKITLPELLRLVQLFTAGEYEQCIGGSEDGYCITVP